MQQYLSLSTFLPKRRPLPTVTLTAVITSLAFLLNAILIIATNATSLVGYFYFLLMALVLYRLFVGKITLEPLLLYAMYSFLVIILYLLQYWSYPEYYGFSGGLGVGTDDSFFYSQVANVLPADFPLRERNYSIQPYSRLMQFVSWHSVTHPLDILFFNVIPLVLLPGFTRRVAIHLTGQEKVGQTAYKLVAICPFLLANSLILIRDGWVAMGTIGGTALLIEQKYTRMTALLLLTFYLRVASGLLLFFILLGFAVVKFNRKKGTNKLLYAFGFLVGMGILVFILYPTIDHYLTVKRIYSNGLFRETFLSFVERSAQASGAADSISLLIYQQPTWIRLPIGFIYYFMSPFFIPTFLYRDIFIPRSLMNNIFAILFVFYLKYFIQAIFHVWGRRSINMGLIVLSYILPVLALSQVSLQIKHKTMLLPLFYVIVAYGYHNFTKPGRIMGASAAFVLALIEIGRSLLRIF